MMHVQSEPCHCAGFCRLRVMLPSLQLPATASTSATRPALSAVRRKTQKRARDGSIQANPSQAKRQPSKLTSLIITLVTSGSMTVCQAFAGANLTTPEPLNCGAFTPTNHEP